MDRRGFLEASGGFAVAALGAFSVSSAEPLGIPVGLQLYTIKDDLQNDLEGTLRQVAAIGIRDLELINWGLPKAADFAYMLHDLGLRAVSIHVEADTLNSDVQRQLNDAQVLGVKYIVSPGPSLRDARGGVMTLEDWQWNAHLFNRLGEQTQKSGIQFGYHNHALEFAKYGNALAYDELLKGTDPKLVTMELDCGWAGSAGIDVPHLLRKHRGRFQLLHIKDIRQKGRLGEPVDMSSTEVGKGVMDWTKIFAAAKVGGVRHYFVEQEGPFDNQPLDAVRMSYEWLHARK